MFSNSDWWSWDQIKKIWIFPFLSDFAIVTSLVIMLFVED
jgi:hypothetical protein